MPLFFFISGFLAYLSKKNGIKLVLKRFNTLIIPFFMWAIVYYFIREKSNMGLFQYLINVIITPDVGLWFLWVLFFCYLLSSVAKKIPINPYLSFSLMSLFLLIFSLVIKDKIFGINLISKQFPFFILGYFTNSYQNLVFEKIKKFRLIIIALFIMGAFFWMRKEDPLFYKYINLGPLFKLGYIYFVGILGIMSIFSISIDIKENSTNKFYTILSLIGKHTLAIYSIHFLILDHTKLNKDQGILYFVLILIYSSVIIALCMLIEHVICYNSISSRLLFGKDYFVKKNIQTVEKNQL